MASIPFPSEIDNIPLNELFERPGSDPEVRYAARALVMIIDEELERIRERTKGCIQCLFYSICENPAGKCRKFTLLTDNSKCFSCKETKTCQMEGHYCEVRK